ncbi:tetratricopeptide repeat protein [Microbulbifer sp. OS29]|uniref:Tetratricopeptide repeat protein n=1 Tax=Microbulbifer okhotskensis TaxID=2926617 RepID=A0A9X2END5_9GAMM|nr:tetratricopeptide repeat protein [Microbulbifer okhotskensis]MCO1332763.1 tetratricopeptide repeat protein [Microbulbifer okhotskensis]
MHCTDPRRFNLLVTARLLLASLAAITLCACSGFQSSAPAVDGDRQLLTENPYLHDAQRIPQQAQAAMALAHQSYMQKDFAAAESQLVQITDTWPKLSGAWLNLGIVQQSDEKYADAEQSLRQAITANDNNIFAWNRLAAMLRDRGRFEDAEACYNAAIKRWPDYRDAHRNLGILYDLYLQQPERALQHYQAAQDADPEQDKLLNAWIVELGRRL